MLSKVKQATAGGIGVSGSKLRQLAAPSQAVDLP